MSSILAAAVRIAPSLSSQDSTSSLLAVATLNIEDRSLIYPLVKAAVHLSPSFNAQESTSSLCAAATLQCTCPDAIRALAVCLPLHPGFEHPPSS
jgi:hypothetical protein